MYSTNKDKEDRVFLVLYIQLISLGSKIQNSPNLTEIIQNTLKEKNLDRLAQLKNQNISVLPMLCGLFLKILSPTPTL